VAASKICWRLTEGRLLGEVKLERHPEVTLPRYRGANWYGLALWVNRARRQRGWGSFLLAQACRWADEHQKDLWLYVKPHDGSHYVGLVRLYDHHGFKLVEDPQYHGQMERQCR